MTDEEYSAREINQILVPIRDALTRIENQTVKTNGRVSNLEGRQNFLNGGLAVLAILVVPIVIWLITHGFAP